MIRKATLLGMLVVVAASVGACLEDVTGTRPLTLQVATSPATAAVGEDVTITFEATGTNLSRVVIEFGDGEQFVRDYFGPVEVTDFTVHAYTTAGTYTVRGQAIDITGNVMDSVTVTIS